MGKTQKSRDSMVADAEWVEEVPWVVEPIKARRPGIVILRRKKLVQEDTRGTAEIANHVDLNDLFASYGEGSLGGGSNSFMVETCRVREGEKNIEEPHLSASMIL